MKEERVVTDRREIKWSATSRKHHEVQNYGFILLTTGLLQKNNPYGVKAPSWKRACSYNKEKHDFCLDTQSFTLMSESPPHIFTSSLLLSTRSYLLILSKHLTATVTQLTWHFPFLMHRHPMLVLCTLHSALSLFSRASDHSNACWFAFSRESIKLSWQY